MFDKFFKVIIKKNEWYHLDEYNNKFPINKEKFEIISANVNLLERQVETDKIRLERGQITLSDVAQSYYSFAGAKAKLIQAENDLLTSRLNYENVIGQLNDIETLDKSSIIDLNLSMTF